MNPSRARTAAAVVVATCLAMAGCAGDVAPTDAPATTAAAPEQATLDWTSSVCSALGPVYRTLRAPPAPDLSDPAATRNAYLGYLQDTAGAVDRALGGIEQAGAPPLDGGRPLVEDLRAQLTDLREDLTAARDRLAATDTGDLAAITAGLRAAGEAVAAFGSGAQVRGVLAQEPAVVEAVERVPECTALPLAGAGG